MLDSELHLNLEDIEVQRAIIKVLGLRNHADLIGICPNAETIFSQLRGFDFQELRIEELERIELSEAIIPESVLGMLNEKDVKTGGEIWVIHNNDEDYFPSNPHAHNYQKGIKLDLSNGNYFRRRKFVGKITKKEMKNLRSLIKHVDLPSLSV